MAYIVKVCSKCKANNQPHMGYCARCGATLPILKVESDTPPIEPPAYAAQPDTEPAATHHGASGESTDVAEYVPPTLCRIVDIDMPFWSMVNFMVKWAIAAIPAFIILIILGLFAVAVLSAIGVSLGR
ncbi:MAG: hypothetical protein AB1514_14770 [Pseudomonadota bacterium]